MSFKDRFSSIRRVAGIVGKKLAAKGWLYWITVVILTVLGTWLGGWLEGQDFAIRPRHWVYQAIQEQGPRQPFIQRTAVVLIGDEEYWKGELARRVPIKREYLARLIKTLAEADPTVIAVDFDLRSQVPDGSLPVSKDYEAETKQLLDAIKEVSKDRPIIIPKTIRFESGYYTTESDVYDHYDFEGGSVSKGYVALPSDVRKLPLKLIMRDGEPLDSFAVAIVRAVNEAALHPVKDERELPFLRYLAADSFESLSPTNVLNKEPVTWKKIRHNIVIIGAGWNTRAYGRGGPVDTYYTPVGPLQGALLHANYVEALLDNRTSRNYTHQALKVIEATAALIVAITFALLAGPISRILGVLSIVVILVLYGYLSLLVLGLFYDFFVPVLLVVGHAVYEWLEEALTHKHKPAT